MAALRVHSGQTFYAEPEQAMNGPVPNGTERWPLLPNEMPLCCTALHALVRGARHVVHRLRSPHSSLIMCSRSRFTRNDFTIFFFHFDLSTSVTLTSYLPDVDVLFMKQKV